MNWHHALDVQMEQHKWTATNVGRVFTTGFFESYYGKFPTEAAAKIHDAEIRAQMSATDAMWHHLTATLWRADTIFITEDMMTLLTQAAHDLPDDVNFDLRTFISPVGFVLFERGLHGTEKNGKTVGLHALAWSVLPKPGNEDNLALGIYFFTDSNDEEDEINQAMLPQLREAGIPIPPLGLSHFFPAIDGDVLPQADHPGTELVCGLLKIFVAMQFLAQQRIGEPMQMRPPRASRRRMSREYDLNEERLITLITLRRKSVKHDDEPHKVDWSHRWVVRGHWRRQWYPSIKRHGWVYIYEQIRGPEDKPLLIKERRVFNFRR